jgi:hypothetical protein
MTVSDNNVSDALTYLAADPHPFAVARFNVTVAENKAKAKFAELFLLSGEKTNDAKKADAESHPEYTDAKQLEADAILELERHRARTRAAEMLLEVWRSENANARAAERVR